MRTNHLSKMRARQAAKDYMHGADLRAQSEELSDKFLGVKFGCSSFTIRKVREHMPVVALDEEDQLHHVVGQHRQRDDDGLPDLEPVDAGEDVDGVGAEDPQRR